MPSEAFNKYSDHDLGAIIAYLKTLPPVDNEVPESKVGPIGRIFVPLDPSLFSVQLIDHAAPRAPAPSPGVTEEYGATENRRDSRGQVPEPKFHALASIPIDDR